jgi:hypothetical protein
MMDNSWLLPTLSRVAAFIPPVMVAIVASPQFFHDRPTTFKHAQIENKPKSTSSGLRHCCINSTYHILKMLFAMVKTWHICGMVIHSIMMMVILIYSGYINLY